MMYADTMYINTNEHYRSSVETETREDRFIKWWKRISCIKVEKSNPILQRLRSIKDPIELDLMQTACNITEKVRRLLLKTRLLLSMKLRLN